MKEQIKKVLSSNNLVINENIIKLGIKKDLSLKEFLVLSFLINNASKKLDLELLSNTLGIEQSTSLETLNSLMIKGLVVLESVKDELNRFNEVVNLDNIYELIYEDIDIKEKKEIKDDIFKTFERELGRTISQMEIELINGWIINGTKEELIIGALREAVYNGVNSFRYIDKIIYEWEKKGFKTIEDVNKHLKNRREEKSKNIVVEEKEQKILDYDWLDN